MAMTGLIVIFSALGGTLGWRITAIVFARFDGIHAFYFSLIPMTLLLILLFLFKREADPFDRRHLVKIGLPRMTSSREAERARRHDGAIMTFRLAKLALSLRDRRHRHGTRIRPDRSELPAHRDGEEFRQLFPQLPGQWLLLDDDFTTRDRVTWATWSRSWTMRRRYLHFRG